MQTKQAGLTLIELLVVVVIMAVIAAVGYPMYTGKVAKTRRADAKVALESVALAQERYYTIAGQYAASLGSLQVSSAIQGGTSDQGYYTIAVTRSGSDNEQYTATATPVSTGAQASDSGCTQFSLTHLGVKTATGSTAGKCW